MLWDKEEGRIVSNESQDIVRMLNGEFNAVAKNPDLDLYPPDLRREIDALNERVYDEVNNGVYRTGFATSQEAYEEAFHALFERLAALEELLGERRYLAGDRITEADWRLWVTLLRFDAVYYVHFRCNGRRLVDHPNLWAYARELYQQPGVARDRRVGRDQERALLHDPRHAEPEADHPRRAARHGLGRAARGAADASLRASSVAARARMSLTARSVPLTVPVIFERPARGAVGHRHLLDPPARGGGAQDHLERPAEAPVLDAEARAAPCAGAGAHRAEVGELRAGAAAQLERERAVGDAARGAASRRARARGRP